MVWIDHSARVFGWWAPTPENDWVWSLFLQSLMKRSAWKIPLPLFRWWILAAPIPKYISNFSSSEWDLIISPSKTCRSIMKQFATIKLIVWSFSSITLKQYPWCVDNILIGRHKITSFIGIALVGWLTLGTWRLEQANQQYWQRGCVLRVGVDVKIEVMTGGVSWRKPEDSWALIECMSSWIWYMPIPSFQCHNRISFCGPEKLALEALPIQVQQILEWVENSWSRVSLVGVTPQRRVSEKWWYPAKLILPPREKPYFFSASVHIEFQIIGLLDSKTSIWISMQFQFDEWISAQYPKMMLKKNSVLLTWGPKFKPQKMGDDKPLVVNRQIVPWCQQTCVYWFQLQLLHSPLKDHRQEYCIWNSQRSQIWTE